jgi:hypothetical protein
VNGANESAIKTLFVSVRPARIAVLLNHADPDWQDTCLRAVEYFSTIWGGSHCILIPTDGERVEEIFWKLLEAFDPDHIYAYRKTLGDIKISSPEKFQALLDTQVEKFIAANPTSERNTIQQRISEMLERRRTDNFEIPSALQQQIGFRVAPLHFQQRFVEPGAVEAGAEARHPLTAIHDLLPSCEHPRQLTEWNVTVPAVPPIWYAAVRGLYNPSYREKLKNVGIEIGSRVYGPADASSLINYTVTGSEDERTPFDLSMVQLEHRVSINFHHWEEPSVVVVGEALEDFCLFFSLSRIRPNVSWLLPSWLSIFSSAIQRAQKGGEQLSGPELYAFHFAHAALRTSRSAQRDAKIVLVSASADRGQLQQWLTALDEAASLAGSDVSSRVEVRSSIEGLIRWPLRIFGRENVSRDTTRQFIRGQMIGPLDTPKPKGFTEVNPYNHRWMTEFVVKDHRLPKHSALGKFVARHPALESIGVRSGATGVAYFCPNLLITTREIDSLLIRPQVFIPETLDIFNALAGNAKMRCNISDKGHFLAETMQKFGGLDEYGQFFRNARHRALFDKFLDTDEVAKGIVDEGVYLKSDRRRYLDFAAIRKALSASDKEVGELIDILVRHAVFYRGFVFKCSFCRNADWFSVNDVGQEFKCKRCNRVQTYTTSHSLGRLEPPWFYKLDEIVYQGYLNNMTVPGLTLYHQDRTKKESCLFCSELEFWNLDTDKLVGEIDVCCVTDGVLSIGEAKKKSSLGDNAAEDAKGAAKYLSLAKAIGARNVIFATTAPEWAARTQSEIQRVFADRAIGYIFLAGAELL